MPPGTALGRSSLAEAVLLAKVPKVHSCAADDGLRLFVITDLVEEFTDGGGGIADRLSSSRIRFPESSSSCRANASVAVSDGQLLLRTDQNLYCIK